MIKILYLLTNRGRANEQVLSSIIKEIEQNENFVFFFDEVDSIDEHIGLDGREIFKLIKKYTKRKDIYTFLPKDKTVGLAFVASNSMDLIDSSLKQINKFDLIFPQGKSEHYSHFRLIARFNIQDTKFHDKPDKINVIVQHNSAFIRPIRRAIQSFEAMWILKRFEKDYPKSMNILIRDQNTWIPGEGKLEKFFRWMFGLYSPTDLVKREYNIKALETDTGGLNRLVGVLIRTGIYNFISKNIITLVDKIESFLLSNNIETKLAVKIKPQFIFIKNLDHGILSIEISQTLPNQIN